LRKLFKNPKVVGTAAFWGTKLLKYTLQIKVQAHPDYKNDQPYLFAFWHGKQLLPVLQLVRHNTPNTALVSPSRDGELLAVWLQKLGYDIVRGSSRDNNVRSTVQLLQRLQAGHSVGFGVDGPIGPMYQVKPGIIYMAQKCNIPIVPLGSAFSRKWLFNKAWDHYQVPKPFARAGYYIGEPIIINKNTDLERANIELGYLLHRAECKAAELLFDCNTSYKGV
jgi:lysophospholipid acyltransferase (LPLAT)-like uncharacterized protein